MPTDQPENPRIRTKVARLDDQVDERYFQILERLRAGAIDVELSGAAQAARLIGDLAGRDTGATG